MNGMVWMGIQLFQKVTSFKLNTTLISLAEFVSLINFSPPKLCQKTQRSGPESHYSPSVLKVSLLQEILLFIYSERVFFILIWRLFRAFRVFRTHKVPLKGQISRSHYGKGLLINRYMEGPEKLIERSNLQPTHFHENNQLFSLV